MPQAKSCRAILSMLTSSFVVTGNVSGAVRPPHRGIHVIRRAFWVADVNKGHCQVNVPFPGSVLVWHTRGMNTPAHPYKRHRFPAEIISHCVWLYCRSWLSDLD